MAQSHTRLNWLYRLYATHDIPGERGEPVGDGLHSAHELEVLRAGHALLYEEDDEADRDEGHREDDADGDEHIHGARTPARRGL